MCQYHLQQLLAHVQWPGFEMRFTVTGVGLQTAERRRAGGCAPSTPAQRTPWSRVVARAAAAAAAWRRRQRRRRLRCRLQGRGRRCDHTSGTAPERRSRLGTFCGALHTPYTSYVARYSSPTLAVAPVAPLASAGCRGRRVF
jgi:hypothetical protein